MLPGPKARGRAAWCSGRRACCAAAALCAVLLVELLAHLLRETDGEACARAVVSDSQLSDADMKPAQLRAHRLAEFETWARPEQPTLRELMQLPSSFALPHDGANVSVTVVLNHFKRKTLCAQIEALLAQTAVPSHIWLVLFGSPIARTLERVARSYNDSRTSISVVESALNLKYYGRMQVALRAPTEFVLIIDDDMIPGKKFIEQMMRTAHTREYERALLGSIGWILPRPGADGRFASYRELNGSGGVYFPDEAYGLLVETASETDYLCSLWFARTRWLAMIFREAPPTFETSEDLQLSLLLRKYAHVRSVVMPVQPDDKETWADTAHRLAWVEASTTGPGAKAKSGSNTPARDRAWWLGLGGGGSTRGLREGPPLHTPLLLVTSEADALALRPLYEQLLRRADGRLTRRPLVALAAPAHACEGLVRAIGAPVRACADDERALFVLNLRLGEAALGGARRPSEVLDEVMGDLAGVLGAFQPSVLLHALAPPAAGVATGARAFEVAPDGDGGSARAQLLLDGSRRAAVVARGAAAACAMAGVPLIPLPLGEAADVAWLAQLPAEALSRWSLPRISLIVRGGDAALLERTLGSLLTLRLLGDRVPLCIQLTPDAQPAAIAFAQREFVWAHGPRSVTRPMRGSELEAMRVGEAWYPSDEHAVALVLSEGDRLSPHAYAWVKYALLRYRYADAPSLAAATRGLLGIGLQPAPPRALAHGAPPRARANASGAREERPEELAAMASVSPPERCAAVLDARIREDALCLMPESWIEFHEAVYTALKSSAEAAEAQAANSGTAWQSVLAAMTGQSAAAEHDSVRWQTLLDRLALGSRWTPPSALLRPHLVDTDGVPIAFIETARPAGYAMRLATGAVPFGHDDRALPSIAELTHALAGKLRPQRS
ncbi:hypothetical protein KFE25_009039 [Diacronema lutheri]|uniref:Glycosyltransferase 2-like domain-containing protein n=2 Tax=Diacronema lutheri TaxID=2081491 RepID=A0A8J6CK30_DIALT|nr:hypothetical protein KFE25_009039 [Diacronema lutheri]